MMLFLHLGPLQLEVRRRPLAGVMIPPVGEQDPADIQEHAGDRSRFLHFLFFHRSDRRSSAEERVLTDTTRAIRYQVAETDLYATLSFSLTAHFRSSLYPLLSSTPDLLRLGAYPFAREMLRAPIS